MSIQKTSIQIAECREKQSQLCEEKNYPHFAPRNGICFRCNKNIYQNYQIGDIILKGKTGEVFITGCPHCHISYCD